MCDPTKIEQTTKSSRVIEIATKCHNLVITELGKRL